MNPVEGRPIQMALPLTGTTPSVAPAGGTSEGEILSTPDARPITQSAGSAVSAGPKGALAALLDEARAARAELGRQPLPITNHNSQLIMKLLGG